MGDSDNDQSDEGRTEGTIKALTGLVKAVPVYDDALKPVAQEAGRALGTVGRAVNAALTPLKGLVWGVETIEEFVQDRVAIKLKSVPPENIQSPDLAVAGPALESLRYTGHNETLSEMYANLLASSMDKETASQAHPGFVEIIRNMSSDEAKLLTYFYNQKTVPVIDIRREARDNSGGYVVNELVGTYAHDAGCEHREFAAAYMVNLERLGLVTINRGAWLAAPDAYDRITEDPKFKEIVERLDQEEEHKSRVEKFFVSITPFGRQFGKACIASKSGDLK